VPEQVSVIGYDDTDAAKFSAPRLSSVHIAWQEMTMNALNHLLNLCYEENRPVTREFKVEMSWRNSVGKAGGKSFG
jgi:LacI family transcriptional regulator